MERRVMFVGRSNLRCIVDGFETLISESSRRALGDVSCAMIRKGDLVHVTWENDQFTRKVTKRPTDKVVDRTSPAYLAIVWGGNQINERSLVATGPPFDVVTDDDGSGDGARDPDATLIPCSVVTDMVRCRLDSNATLTALVDPGRRDGRRISFVCPPPPLPEPAIRERIDQEAYFKPILQAMGRTTEDLPIVPGAVRVRLWRLMVETYRSFAAVHDLDFLDVPPGAVDADGFLGSEYWGRDSTHANPAYGVRCIEQVAVWKDGAAA